MPCRSAIFLQQSDQAMRKLKNILIDVLFLIGMRSVAARFIGVRFGHNVRLIGAKRKYFGSEPFMIKLGSNVTISTEVQFLTHDGGVALFRSTHGPVDRIAPIEISDNVFVGCRCILLPGVHICSNVIVGAGSVVSKSIVKPGVYAGVPAKFICSLDDYYKKNKKFWTMTHGLPTKIKRNRIK